MKHLTEEQLVLYYYREGEELADVEEHIACCDACRAAYQELESALRRVEAPVPERGEDYGSQVWQRLRPRLEQHRFWTWPRWAFAGGMAALVVAAFLAGRFWPRPVAQSPQPIAQPVRERILLVAVGDHLERSQMVLLELVNAKGNGKVDISEEQQRAQDLIAANRLYRQTAARSGEPGVASVLEELERFLLEIAHGPSEFSTNRLEEIRRRIEAEGILFKVRIIDSRIREREKSNAQS